MADTFVAVRNLEDLTEFEVQQWSSFKELIDPVFKGTKHKIVELGSGFFSTPYLPQFCNGPLISIDLNGPWVDMLKVKYPDLDVKYVILNSDEEIKKYISDFKTDIEVLFVDHSGNRIDVVNHALRENIDNVILHDFTVQDASVIFAEGYYLLTNYGTSINPTAMFTKNEKIIEKLKQNIKL